MPTCLKKLVIVAFALAQWSRVHWHCVCVCFFFSAVRLFEGSAFSILLSLECPPYHWSCACKFKQAVSSCFNIFDCAELPFVCHIEKVPSTSVYGPSLACANIECANETIPIVLAFGFCLMGYVFFLCFYFFFFVFFIWQLAQTYF